MKSYSVLLGARNTAGGGQRFRARDEALIRSVTQRHFPSGFTILKSRGGWFDPDARRFRQEESRQILIGARSRAQLRAWCHDLAAALGQKEVLVVELGRMMTFRHAAK